MLHLSLIPIILIKISKKNYKLLSLNTNLQNLKSIKSKIYSKYQIINLHIIHGKIYSNKTLPNYHQINTNIKTLKNLSP